MAEREITRHATGLLPDRGYGLSGSIRMRPGKRWCSWFGGWGGTFIAEAGKHININQSCLPMDADRAGTVPWAIVASPGDIIVLTPNPAAIGRHFPVPAKG